MFGDNLKCRRYFHICAKCFKYITKCFEIFWNVGDIFKYVQKCLKYITKCLRYITKCLRYITKCLKYITKCLKYITKCSEIFWKLKLCRFNLIGSSSELWGQAGKPKLARKHVRAIILQNFYTFSLILKRKKHSRSKMYIMNRKAKLGDMCSCHGEIWLRDACTDF